jgi:hypothetical protein
MRRCDCGAFPGPLYLLLEAFFKSGTAVTQADDKKKNSGFIFLTDGGHIDNLGIYELFRRRCRLIIAIDAEADPKLLYESWHPSVWWRAYRPVFQIDLRPHR